MKRIILSCFLSLCFLSQVLAADFGGIGGRPANPNPDYPHNKEWFLYTLKPGETKEDALIVENNDDTPVTIILYPADSTPSTDGGFALEQKVEHPDFIGKWITLSQNEVKLQPHQSALVPFTISIPNDPKIDVGEHTGGILLQKAHDEPSEVGGMQLLTRVGVRVYVTIPGEVIKKLEIVKFGVEPSPPPKKLYTASLMLKNSGNVSQDVKVKMTVTNLYPWLNSIPFIKDLYKDFPIQNQRNLQVLRDDSLISNFEIKRPFWGKLKIEGSVEYDNGAQILRAEPIELDVSLDPQILLLIVLVVAFIVLLIAFLVVRRKNRREQKNLEHTVQPRDVKLVPEVRRNKPAGKMNVPKNAVKKKKK